MCRNYRHWLVEGDVRWVHLIGQHRVAEEVVEEA